jgi:iron complex transport system permease protein
MTTMGWRQRWPGPPVLVALVTLTVLASGWALNQGALPVDWRALWAADEDHAGAAWVIWQLRLPRVLLAVLVGAGLGLAGALMQGLFRNPLADPGLIGVSSGAALAAGLTIVGLAAVWPQAPRLLGSWTLVLMAFGGGLLTTWLVYRLASSTHGVRVGVMLLAGIAVNALAGAGIGMLGYIANDEQLRNYQLWMLGSLSGARWASVWTVAAVVMPLGVVAIFWAQPLNALALGEAQAALLGVDLERLKRRVLWVTALITGACTATVGAVGFIGLVAPHMVRLVLGPDHRWVLPGAALTGACLVVLADAAARTWLAPAEMPLGVLTALLGVPMFVALLRRTRRLDVGM